MIRIVLASPCLLNLLDHRQRIEYAARTEGVPDLVDLIFDGTGYHRITTPVTLFCIKDRSVHQLMRERNEPGVSPRKPENQLMTDRGKYRSERFSQCWDFAKAGLTDPCINKLPSHQSCICMLRSHIIIKVQAVIRTSKRRK